MEPRVQSYSLRAYTYTHERVFLEREGEWDLKLVCQAFYDLSRLAKLNEPIH